MPLLDTLLLRTPAHRGDALPNTADESREHSKQGGDFASVMQATLAPQHPTTPSKFSPRPGTKPDAANRSSFPANGTKTPAAINASRTHLSAGNGSLGKATKAKEKSATSVNAGTANSTSDAAVSKDGSSISGFLPFPSFATGTVSPPPVVTPKASTNGNGTAPSTPLSGNPLNTSNASLPATTPVQGTDQGGNFSQDSLISATPFAAPAASGSSSINSNSRNGTATIPQAGGATQPAANGITVPVSDENNSAQPINNTPVQATLTAGLPLPQASANDPASPSAPVTVDASNANTNALTPSDLPMATLPPATGWQQNNQAPAFVQSSSPGLEQPSTVTPSVTVSQPINNGSGQAATALQPTNGQSVKSDISTPSTALEVSNSTAALATQPTVQNDLQNPSPVPVPVTAAAGAANTSFGTNAVAKGPATRGMVADRLAGQNDGTGVANSDSLMKMLQKTNKVAGSDVKVLPVGQNGQASGNILPDGAAGSAHSADNRSADLNFNFSNGNSQPSVSENAQIQSSIDLPSLTDARLRTIDRAHDMMALHSMRLIESKSDTLSVVIKPSVGTELSLELRQNGTEIQAHATLNRGDHQLLSQHWSELQQRLEQRGIKLAPLESEAGFSANDNGQFRQQQTSQEEAAQQASAFAEFASVTSPAGGASARVVSAQDGWESWA